MNQDKKFFSKIGFNYLTYAVLTIILPAVILNVIALWDSNLVNSINFQSVIIIITNYILPFPILIFLMGKLESERPKKHGLDIKTIIIYISITFTLLWVGNIIGLAATYLLGNAMQTTITNPVEELINSQDIWLNLAFISIIGPVFEEIFFRKLLIDRTIRYGVKVSIILSAVLFAFMHANLNQFFYALLMGGFFAYVYIKTGKITYTIILHIAVNFVGSVVSLIVAESVSSITRGASGILDIGIVIIYLLFILTMFLLGTAGLAGLRKHQSSELTGEIELEKPYRNMFVNPGMMCYLGFCILITIYQII